MDVARQVPRHRLVRVHQAVALVVVRQVNHPVQHRNLTLSKFKKKCRKKEEKKDRKNAPVKGVVHGLPYGMSKE